MPCLSIERWWYSVQKFYRMVYCTDSKGHGRISEGLGESEEKGAIIWEN